MQNIIEVQSLVKKYKDVCAVRDISFSVEEGSFFSFLGVNGAGKSTTINILCTVLEKTSGCVKIGGYDLDKQKAKIKELIGIVFQNSVLDKQLTVKENLISRASYYGFSKTEAKSRIKTLAEIFELDGMLDRKYINLSGGQRRRVDIVRALINRPKILFLDEPTTGLDPHTRMQVWSIINKLRKETGLTVFLTTHYMEETSDCDNVVIIDSGKISACDTPHNLKKKYASNSFVWYTRKSEFAETLLNNEGLSFEYAGDAYKIKISDCSDATRLVTSYPQISDYEVIKGNMDDVFLKITGKRLGE